MTELLKEGLMILSGIIGGTLFVLIKNKLFKTAKQEVLKVIPEEDKKKVQELADKGFIPQKLATEICTPPTTTECFDKSKAVNGLVNVKSSVLWMKDIASIFNLRKLIIIGIIIGCIYGYGWYRGRIGKEVHFDMRGKKAIIQLNEHYLKIEKDGTANVVDKDGKILKKIRVKDIDGLRKALRPYGFILEPILVAGGSLGETGARGDIGVGLSWFKWFKTKIQSSITHRGIYPIGIGYGITDNSGVALGGGIGYKGDKRTTLYYYWRF